MKTSVFFTVVVFAAIAVLTGTGNATLSYWNGPGYGQDTYTGEDGIPGYDGKGVELQGTAGYGEPGNGGNEGIFVSGTPQWIVFEVLSSYEIQYGRMKLYIYDPQNGWQTFTMLSDSGYSGSGYRYWLSLVVSDEYWADIYPSDEIKYYFQDWNDYSTLPESAGSGGPYLDAPNFTIQGEEAFFQIELSDTPADMVPGERATWDVDITNTGGETGTFDYWMEVEGPLTKELRRIIGLTLDPGEIYHAQFYGVLPTSAGLGNYTVTAYTGTYPSEVQSSDQFDCIVETIP